MTANQINYMNSVYNQSLTKMSNDETARHNKAMEDVQSRLADVNERAQRADEQYKVNMAELNKWEAEHRIALQTAQGNAKLRIEDKLANIESRKVDETTAHNTIMEDIERARTGLTEKMNDIVNTHNQNMETIQEAINYQKSWMDKQTVALQNKQMELDAQRIAWEEFKGINLISQGAADLALKQIKTSIDARLADLEGQKTSILKSKTWSQETREWLLGISRTASQGLESLGKAATAAAALGGLK